MTEEENRSLQVVVLRTDVRQERYGASDQFNWKKVGLSRAYFKKELVSDASLPTDRARAAFDYLYRNNTHYKKFWEYHKERLAQKQSLNISSYDPFAKHKYDGSECAMFPHLYPKTDFSDTGRMSAYHEEVHDDANRVFSI